PVPLGDRGRHRRRGGHPGGDGHILSAGAWERPNVAETPGQVSAARAAVLLGRSHSEHAARRGARARDERSSSPPESERGRNAPRTRRERRLRTLPLEPRVARLVRRASPWTGPTRRGTPRSSDRPFGAGGRTTPEEGRARCCYACVGRAGAGDGHSRSTGAVVGGARTSGDWSSGRPTAN